MFEFYLVWEVATYMLSVAFGVLFARHVIKAKREGEPWSKGMLVALIFFTLLWVVPLIFGIILLFALYKGFRGM